MTKPHLIICGGRVLQFKDRSRAAVWVQVFGHLTNAQVHNNPKTFREWKERKSRFILATGHRDALPLGVAERRYSIVEPATATSRMLEAWRTRGPLFGRKGGPPHV